MCAKGQGPDGHSCLEPRRAGAPGRSKGATAGSPQRWSQPVKAEGGRSRGRGGGRDPAGEAWSQQPGSRSTASSYPSIDTRLAHGTCPRSSPLGCGLARMGSETHTGMSTPTHTHTHSRRPCAHAQGHVRSHTPLLLVPSLRQVSEYCKRLSPRGRTAKVSPVCRLLSHWDDAPGSGVQGKDWATRPAGLHSHLPAGPSPLQSGLGSSLRSRQRGRAQGTRTARSLICTVRAA